MDPSQIIDYSPIRELVRRMRRWVEAADIDLDHVEPEDRAEYEDYKDNDIAKAILNDWKAMYCQPPSGKFPDGTRNHHLGIYSRMKVATWLVDDYIGRVVLGTDSITYPFLYGDEPPSAEQMIDFWTDYYKYSR